MHTCKIREQMHEGQSMHVQNLYNKATEICEFLDHTLQYKYNYLRSLY